MRCPSTGHNGHPFPNSLRIRFLTLFESDGQRSMMKARSAESAAHSAAHACGIVVFPVDFGGCSLPTGGARLSATKPAAKPVNASRREFPLSAFRVFCLSRRGFRRSADPPGALGFERDKPGVRWQPWGLLPHPRISARNSQTLGLTRVSGLTTWYRPDPESNPLKRSNDGGYPIRYVECNRRGPATIAPPEDSSPAGRVSNSAFLRCCACRETSDCKRRAKSKCSPS